MEFGYRTHGTRIKTNTRPNVLNVVLFDFRTGKRKKHTKAQKGGYSVRAKRLFCESSLVSLCEQTNLEPAIHHVFRVAHVQTLLSIR
jgi:hypothetical protein